MEGFLTESDTFSRFERHSRLHRLYRRSGDEAEALQHLEACRRLAPEDPERAIQWLDLLVEHGC